jgi:hypothetical protein
MITPAIRDLIVAAIAAAIIATGLVIACVGGAQ